MIRTDEESAPRARRAGARAEMDGRAPGAAGAARERDDDSQGQAPSPPPPAEGPEEGAGRDAPSTTATSEAGERIPYTYCLGVTGWLFCYYFGVVKQLKEHGMHARCRVVGSSGGALAGLFLVEELDCEEVRPRRRAPRAGRTRASRAGRT